jgi:alkanesulfonate monooxygenase SsuD/methylene tetrahydromethanopterin reductase-like flavin-dependent oxidoreductase (luciferase family)
MLPHYSALKVAGQFRVLEGIAPGRIDLGVGRAPGSGPANSVCAQPHQKRGRGISPAGPRPASLVSCLPLEPGHGFRDIRRIRKGPTSPQLWILGSSDYGAQLAAYLGLPYAYAYFFTEGRGTERSAGTLSHALPPE